MFVELHARSAFSFLEAAALPEALAERAARFGQPAIALLDADGIYGAPRLYRACTRLGLSALVGAEVTLADGSRLPLLAEDREGYQNLCRLLTRVKMRAPKGESAATLEAAGRRLARNSEHFMKSGATMERLFSDCPEAVANTGELAMRLGFTLKDLGYRFPDYPLPRGETPIGFLRELAHAGAR